MRKLRESLSRWTARRREEKTARKTARAAFLTCNPGERIAWTTSRADEPDRWIIGVFYGETKPPYYQFFEVDKTTGLARELEDDSSYRPKVWR